jgi:hypothetical protein
LITRRVAAALLAIISLGAGLGVAACGSSDSGSSDSGGGHPATAASSRSELVASVDALATTTYAMTLTTSRVSAIGTVDPIAGSVTMTTKAKRGGEPVTIENLTLADRSWARVDIGALDADYGIDPAKWLKLDPSLLTAGSLPYDQSRFRDAFDLSDVLAGVTTATRGVNGHYSGRINLAGVAGVASMVPAGSGLGAGAGDLPFTAVLDARGRLTDLHVTGSDPAAAFDFGISDYSASTAADPPNDIDVMAAPADAYGLLRGDRLTP